MSRAPARARWGHPRPACWQKSGCAIRRRKLLVCRPLIGTSARPGAAEVYSAGADFVPRARPVPLLRRSRAIGAPRRHLASAARAHRDCGRWFAAAPALRVRPPALRAAQRERSVAPRAALMLVQVRAAGGPVAAQQLAARLAALPRAQRGPAKRLSVPLRAEQVRRALPAPHVRELRARAARLRLSVLRLRVSRSLPRERSEE